MSSNVTAIEYRRPEPEDNDRVSEKRNIDKHFYEEVAGFTGTEEGLPEDLLQLDAGHQRALALLLSGYSQAETANRVGVSKRTVSRWMTPGNIVYEVYLRKRYQLWEATNQRLDNLYLQAIEKLQDLLHSEDQRVAMGATKIVLSKHTMDRPFNPDVDLPKDRAEYMDMRFKSSSYKKRAATGFPGRLEPGIPQETKEGEHIRSGEQKREVETFPKRGEC